MKLTDMLLRNLKPKAQRYWSGESTAWGPGYPQGSEELRLYVPIEGKARLLTLGDYPR